MQHAHEQVEMSAWFWWANLKQRECQKDLLKEILKVLGWDSTDWICLTQDRPLMGCCEHGEEPFSFTKCGNFLTT